jgi:hypothetical protein
VSEPVATKAQMYRLLAAGRFGNTTPQFFSVEDWKASPDAARYPTWGVRTLTPGGPCRFDVAHLTECLAETLDAMVLKKAA